MYQKERIDSIMDILHRKNYVTVKYLVDTLHYSNATINRDLNIMEKQKLITRSYGGVKLDETALPTLEFRYDKLKIEKRKMSKCAAGFIENGDTIFIDASTTCQGIGTYITEKKDITVITNNLALVSFLCEYGIKVICTGGYVSEPPYMLDGPDAVRTAMKYKTDKLFFSTSTFSEDGCIGDRSDMYETLREVTLKNTDRAFYLSDHTKMNIRSRHIVSDFSNIDTVITDCDFGDNVKNKFSETTFVNIGALR